jgi:signal transduction histidine kinase
MSAPEPVRRWRGVLLPLGARLVGLFVVLAVAVSVTFVFGMHAVQHEGWRGYVHPLMSNYADMLVAEIGMPPDIERARALATRLPLHIRIEGPTVNWDSADEPRPPRPAMPPPPFRPPFPPRGSSGAFAPHPVVSLPNGGQPIPLILPERRHPPAMASAPGAGPAPGPGPRPMPHHLLPRATELDPAAFHIVRYLADGHRIWIGLADMLPPDGLEHVGWITLAMLLLLTGIAYAVVRHMLRPIQALRAGAIRYGQGDFSQPIEPRNRDELGDLAVEMNGMAARLHRMLDAKRQLLLSISHELRSPLARARINAELIDESTERTALLRDLGEIRDLITDLLESERLADMRAGGHAALQAEPTDLGDLVRRQCQPQEQAGLARLDVAEGLPVLLLDRVRVRLLLRNLLDNALRHGTGAADVPLVQVRASADARSVSLILRDHGPGMDESQLQHAGDAFYRADAARQRSTGGVGLGLYLCRLIVEAHGGRLELRNAAPGLEAEASFPAPEPPLPPASLVQ